MDTILELLREFLPNSLGVWVVFGLAAWILMAYLCRLFIVTFRRSVTKEIEAAFTLPELQDRSLGTALASPLILKHPAGGDDASMDWTLSQVTRAYWLFKLKGLSIQISACLMVIVPIFIAIFDQAGVKESKGSLVAVIEAFGVFAMGIVAILFTLSLLKAVCSVHELPIPIIKKAKLATITLFLW